jgi:hypothetical protein
LFQSLVTSSLMYKYSPIRMMSDNYTQVSEVQSLRSA